MKTKIGILVLALSTSFFSLQAQRTVTTTRATSNEISDNLDLDAVASIFGDSENLEDFERRLNDPNNKISNLDLNEDGYIDYLRIVENSSENNSLVVVQAVLDQDVYQDVATIEVERVSNGNPRIQIVGDPYIYGSNYIIEPYFVRTPLIFSFFWGSHYSPWRSPYYWNYYPNWYSHYRPCSPYKYRRHIYAHINYENKYSRTDKRNIHFSGDNYNRIRRNDFAAKHPDRAFESRNRDVQNRNELKKRKFDNSGEYRSNSRVGSDNQNRRPSNELKSDSERTKTREYKGNSNRSRTENKIKERPKTENRNGSENQRITPKRSTNRVESTQRNSAPREKSGSTSTDRRSKSEVKQKQKSEQKYETQPKEDKTENRRRR